MGRAQKGDVVFCLMLGLIALILWCAIVAWIWHAIGEMSYGSLGDSGGWQA
jgi:hypothetical protein